MNQEPIDEFELWNRWGGNPPEVLESPPYQYWDEENPPFPGSTNLKLRLPINAPERICEELAIVSAKVLRPDVRGPHLEYRMSVIEQFVENEVEPLKIIDGKPFRTEAQTRLDRAFTSVAKSYDVCESTIRAACTRAYGSDGATELFRLDCVVILNSMP